MTAANGSDSGVDFMIRRIDDQVKQRRCRFLGNPLSKAEFLFLLNDVDWEIYIEAYLLVRVITS